MSLLLDIIVMDNRPHSAAYHDQCIASVHVAIEKAGFPCRLVETKGNLRAIAKARGAAFDQTTAPYVTWVVDFDYVLPNYFSAMREGIEGGADAVFSREAHLVLKKHIKSFRRHHGVYKRSIIESVRHIYESGSVDEATAAVLDAAGNALSVDVKKWSYIRRMTHDSVRAQREGMR